MCMVVKEEVSSRPQPAITKTKCLPDAMARLGNETMGVFVET